MDAGDFANYEDELLFSIKDVPIGKMNEMVVRMEHFCDGGHFRKVIFKSFIKSTFWWFNDRAKSKMAKK